MNVVYYEHVCYEQVCYENGLLWTWSVMNVVWYEQVCCERDLFEWYIMNMSVLNGHC